jgi:hypothetical protein
MSILIQLTQLIKTLTPNIRSQNDLDHAYLSNSVDVYDLERRMREIDQRSHEPSRGLAYGSNWS